MGIPEHEPECCADPWPSILSLTEDYSTLCVVRADLSLLSGSAEPKQGKNGKTYWTIVFSVEIHFGLTEFKARIKWNDNVSDFHVYFHTCAKPIVIRERSNSM